MGVPEYAPEMRKYNESFVRLLRKLDIKFGDLAEITLFDGRARGHHDRAAYSRPANTRFREGETVLYFIYGAGGLTEDAILLAKSRHDGGTLHTHGAPLLYPDAIHTLRVTRKGNRTVKSVTFKRNGVEDLEGFVGPEIAVHKLDSNDFIVGSVSSDSPKGELMFLGRYKPLRIGRRMTKIKGNYSIKTSLVGEVYEVEA